METEDLIDLIKEIREKIKEIYGYMYESEFLIEESTYNYYGGDNWVIICRIIVPENYDKESFSDKKDSFLDYFSQIRVKGKLGLFDSIYLRHVKYNDRYVI